MSVSSKYALILCAMNRVVAIASYIATAECAVVGLTYLNFSLPLCSLTTGQEDLLHFASMASIAAFLGFGVFYLRLKGVSGKHLMPVGVLVFFSFVPLFWSTQDRFQDFDKQLWAFDARVTDKYVSGNHGAKSLVIGNKRYEGFTSEIWNEINVGERIHKEACAATISLGDKIYRFPQEMQLTRAWARIRQEFLGAYKISLNNLL